MSHPPVELLAPAGNWECARAAVENGADAIYFGLDVGFNARARADNFHVDELPSLMEMLHRQGVKGYVTLNTLVFTDELPALEANVRQLAEAGVDAVLVQDLGVARFIHRLCPDLALHASTQMTLTSADAIERVRELNIQRAVLARELSLQEIQKISQATTMPLEAFVHGALCVAYSGQCLTSESLGGRSANRGQCAQACRLPYDIFRDGEPVELGSQKYLLSPQDLAAHDYVPQLIAAGICSLKIEGRLKTPEYVANVCGHYRQAIDAALENQHRKLSVEQKRELELSFSRGFSPGWLEGCDHKRLVPGLTSAKQGVLLGTITEIRKDSLFADLVAPVAIGDGIVIEGDRFAGTELGGRVYQMAQGGMSVDRAQQGAVELRMQRGLLQTQSIEPGTRLWKTDDPQLTKRLRRTYDGADPVKRVAVLLHVQVAAGEPIRIEAQVSDGVVIQLTSEHVTEVARKHPVTMATMQEQFSRLGGTVYRLEELTAEIRGEPMIPLSVMGSLRKELIEALDQARVTQPLACAPESITVAMLEQVPADLEEDDEPAATDATLRVLCRSLQQLEFVLEAGVKEVIADFHDLRQYREAVQMAHTQGARIELASLRIHKPGEDGLFRALEKNAADGWLVRNLSAFQYCIAHDIPRACDFSLNVTNPLTAQQFIEWGASRITASYDLNRDQLCELAAYLPAQWLEVVIHQHMPMFHMEHCVFCSVLSPGKNKSDCGRPCDRHDVKLKDRVGAEHVLHADIGCRNTLYNGTAQSGAEAVTPLQELGVQQFRIELLRDAPQEFTQELIQLYRDLVLGRVEGAEVWRKLNADNRIGVTRGTLEQPRNPLAIL
ncbi:U32 family peptidase [Aureliella helgolandensis]|uniref:Putative protease YhbU n=1 Tax=Aureliella helgolandensis TaxID=2527968 RepID=A0A518G564_9BACT|nr:U32 family peptidase [Aureliella helgolandensis]QDV23736.1 putative protease YhbU precursor [Aureliella helgolandensis]